MHGLVIVAVVGYLGVRYQYRDKTPDKPGEASPADRALEDVFARLERLEEAHADLLEANAVLREERAELRAELEQARERHVTDAETIRTLRQRVDDLVRLLTERD